MADVGMFEVREPGTRDRCIQRSVRFTRAEDAAVLRAARSLGVNRADLIRTIVGPAVERINTESAGVT